jgi:uncharacterized repeat protein (TIGR01451 family)
LLGIAIACAAGCAGFRNGGGWTAWRLSDPPQLSPFARSLGGGVPSESARVLTPTDATPFETSPAEAAPAEATPSLQGPSTTTSPSSPSGTTGESETIRQRLDAPAPAGSVPEGPRLGGIEAEEWTLTVVAPESATTGDLVSFQIRVTNNGSAEAADVVLECEFDAGLAFPGRTERHIRQPLDRVAAGEARSVALSLELRATGRQCARFSITQGGRRVAQREVCVQSQSPEIDVTFQGPNEPAVGERAEYVVTIVNRSGRDLPGTTVTLTYDPSLALREASTGAQRSAGQARWNLETLQAEERVQIETAFDRRSEQPAARLTVTIKAGSTEVTTSKVVNVKGAAAPSKAPVP